MQDAEKDLKSAKTTMQKQQQLAEKAKDKVAKGKAQAKAKAKDKPNGGKVQKSKASASLCAFEAQADDSDKFTIKTVEWQNAGTITPSMMESPLKITNVPLAALLHGQDPGKIKDHFDKEQKECTAEWKENSVRWKEGRCRIKFQSDAVCKLRTKLLATASD